MLAIKKRRTEIKVEETLKLAELTMSERKKTAAEGERRTRIWTCTGKGQTRETADKRRATTKQAEPKNPWEKRKEEKARRAAAEVTLKASAPPPARGKRPITKRTQPSSAGKESRL